MESVKIDDETGGLQARGEMVSQSTGRLTETFTGSSFSNVRICCFLFCMIVNWISLSFGLLSDKTSNLQMSPWTV